MEPSTPAFAMGKTSSTVTVICPVDVQPFVGLVTSNV